MDYDINKELFKLVKLSLINPQDDASEWLKGVIKDEQHEQPNSKPKK